MLFTHRTTDTYKSMLLWSVIASSAIFVLIFVLNAAAISQTLVDTDGAWSVLVIILVRITILAGSAFYMFRKWFNQEEQYLSDIPFLFGMFFLLLTFGKTLDLFSNLTFYSFDETVVLSILKVRYFVIILTLAPLVYLGLGIILFSLSFRYEKLTKDFNNKIRTKLIVIILCVESFAILMVLSVSAISLLLPCVIIPSLAGIVYVFLLAYKTKRLSEVNPLILAIGFFLYMISSIIRPIAQNIIGISANFLIFIEIIDLIVCIVIFMGFYLKIDYSNNLS